MRFSTSRRVRHFWTVALLFLILRLAHVLGDGHNYPNEDEGVVKDAEKVDDIRGNDLAEQPREERDVVVDGQDENAASDEQVSLCMLMVFQS